MQTNHQDTLTNEYINDQFATWSLLSDTLVNKSLTGSEFTSTYIPIPSPLQNFFTDDTYNLSNERSLVIIYEGQEYSTTILSLNQPSLTPSPILVMSLSNELKNKLRGLFFREAMDISLILVRSSTDQTTYFLKSESYPLHSTRPSAKTWDTNDMNSIGKEKKDQYSNVQIKSPIPAKHWNTALETKDAIEDNQILYSVEKTDKGWIICCKNATARITKLPSDFDELKYRIETGSTVLKEDHLPKDNESHILREKWNQFKNLVEITDDSSILLLKYPVFLKYEPQVIEFTMGITCESNFELPTESGSKKNVLINGLDIPSATTISTVVTYGPSHSNSQPQERSPIDGEEYPPHQSYSDENKLESTSPDDYETNTIQFSQNEILDLKLPDDELELKRVLRTSLKILGISNDAAKIISVLLINNDLPLSKIQQTSGTMNSPNILITIQLLIKLKWISSFQHKNVNGKLIEHYTLSSPKQIYDELHQKNRLLLRQMTDLLEIIKEEDRKILIKPSIESALTSDLIKLGIDPDIVKLLMYLRFQPNRSEQQITKCLELSYGAAISRIRALYQTGWIQCSSQGYYSLESSLYDIALDYTLNRASLIGTALSSVQDIITLVENSDVALPLQNHWEEILVASLKRALLKCVPLTDSLMQLSMKSPYPPSMFLLLFPLCREDLDNDRYSVRNIDVTDFDVEEDIICCGYIADKEVFIVLDYASKAEILTYTPLSISKVTLDEVAHKDNILLNTLPNGVKVLITPKNTLAKAFQYWYEQRNEDIWFLDEM